MKRVSLIATRITLAASIGTFLLGVIPLVEGVGSAIKDLRGQHTSDPFIGELVVAVVLFIYAGTTAALWKWPNNTFAFITRLVLGTVWVVLWTYIMWSAVSYLREPPDPTRFNCGLPGMAAMFHCLFGAGFYIAELATWVSWWFAQKCRDG